MEMSGRYKTKDVKIEILVVTVAGGSVERELMAGSRRLEHRRVRVIRQKSTR